MAADLFGRLPDELVVKILELESGLSCNNSEHDVQTRWFSPSDAFVLGSICSRFRRLALEQLLHFTVWKLVTSEDSILLKCNSFMERHAPNIEGLDLVFETAENGKQRKAEPLNIFFLLSVLKKAKGLQVLVLRRCAKNSHLVDQSPAACTRFLAQLASLPLKTMHFQSAGFSFKTQPLASVQFSYLQSIKIEKAEISDDLVSSLVLASPYLKACNFQDCYGLLKPALQASQLQELRIHQYSGTIQQLTIIAPRLQTLGLSSSDSLDIEAPQLTEISLTGPLPATITSKPAPLTTEKLIFQPNPWTLQGILQILHSKQPTPLQSISILRSIEVDKGCKFSKDLGSLADLLAGLPRNIQELQLQALFCSLSMYDLSKLLKFVNLESLQLSVDALKQFEIIKDIVKMCPKLERLELELSRLMKRLNGPDLGYRILSRTQKLETEIKERVQIFYVFQDRVIRACRESRMDLTKKPRIARRARYVIVARSPSPGADSD